MTTEIMTIAISTIALFISIVSIAINMLDKSIAIKVGTGVEYVMPEDEEDVQYGPMGKRIWITITNNSMRRVFITNILAVWSWSKWSLNKSKFNNFELDDVQRYEENKPAPVSRFWIEPLGNVVISADILHTEHSLWKKLVEKFGVDQSSVGKSIYYRVVVNDAQQNEFHSKWVKISIDPLYDEGNIFPT